MNKICLLFKNHAIWLACASPHCNQINPIWPRPCKFIFKPNLSNVFCQITLLCEYCMISHMINIKIIILLPAWLTDPFHFNKKSFMTSWYATACVPRPENTLLSILQVCIIGKFAWTRVHTLPISDVWSHLYLQIFALFWQTQVLDSFTYFRHMWSILKVNKFCHFDNWQLCQLWQTF